MEWYLDLITNIAWIDYRRLSVSGHSFMVFYDSSRLLINLACGIRYVNPVLSLNFIPLAPWLFVYKWVETSMPILLVEILGIHIFVHRRYWRDEIENIVLLVKVSSFTAHFKTRENLISWTCTVIVNRRSLLHNNLNEQSTYKLFSAK